MAQRQTAVSTTEEPFFDCNCNVGIVARVFTFATERNVKAHMLTKIFNLAKYALTITTGAAILAACSNNGGSSLAPSGTSSGMPGIVHIAFSPDKKKKQQLYQYISETSSILEYGYPKGDAPIGSIGGIAYSEGECTNVLFGTGKKTFWVTTGTNQIDEFKVGDTSPIETLPTTAGTPVGCAIDPASGDLVATIINSGQVVIYTKATGTGTVSQTPLIEAFFDGFDKSSNLYVDGFNSNDAFGLVELKKGSRRWKTLSTSKPVMYPGGVQFDGKYITVNDQVAHAIFGYMCSGTTCTLKRTVALTGSSDCDQTWIAKGYVLCPDIGNVDVEIYKYPAGGSSIATLTGSFAAPVAAVQVEK
jgi:hypothetical protein